MAQMFVFVPSGFWVTAFAENRTTWRQPFEAFVDLGRLAKFVAML